MKQGADLKQAKEAVGTPGAWYGVVLLAVTTASAWWFLTSKRVLNSDLQETGDTAGDALQVLAGLRSHWLLTGHHSDQGVPHPGPFGLWLKALGELLHDYAGVGLTAMAAVGLVLALATAISVAAAGYVVSRGLRSAAGGAVFLLVALYCARQPSLYPGIPNLTFMLNILSAAALLLALSAAFAAISDPRAAMPYLAAGGGALAHLHTPSAPLGVAALILCAGLTWRERAQRSRRWWATVAIMATFVIPLAVRVVVDWPWPMKVIPAMQFFASRSAAVSQVSFDRWELLPAEVRLLLALVSVSAVVMLAFKASRKAGLVAGVPCAYAFTCWMLASTQTENRTFLQWIPVALLTLIALAAGWAASQVLTAIREPRARRAGAVAIVALALPCCAWLYAQGSVPGKESWREGTNTYSQASAIAVLTAAQGRPIALDMLPEGPFDALPWPAIVLGLERNRADVCLVQPASGLRDGVGMVTGMSGLAGTPTCPDDLTGHVVMAARRFGQQEPQLARVVYRLELMKSQEAWSRGTDPFGTRRAEGYDIGVRDQVAVTRPRPSASSTASHGQTL